MLCRKCKIDIPEVFEYVLQQNTCPKCGSKLMQQKIMDIYLDIKKRLGEVEFVMDKAVVCERIAMFMVSNYEIGLVGAGPIANNVDEKFELINKTAAELDASIDDNATPEEIRDQEYQRAIKEQELADAKDMGPNVGEDMVTSQMNDRVERLKKILASNKSGVKVHRLDD